MARPLPAALLPAALLLAAAVACAEPTAQARRATPSASPTGRDPAQRYEVSTMVLERQGGRPEVCVGSITHSLPPRCGGFPVEPFSWDDVAGEHSARGTTWATLRLVGTFDGAVLHLTEPPGPPARPASEPYDFSSACPEPAGGWRVVDRSKVSDDDQNKAVAYANGQRDIAAVWLTWLPGREPRDGVADPSGAIVNLAFTGDLDRHERAARAVWGGALCVTLMPRSRAELRRVEDRLHALRDEAAKEGVHLYGANAEEVRNLVTALVVVDDEVTRRWLAEHSEPGWVEPRALFRPVH